MKVLYLTNYELLYGANKSLLTLILNLRNKGVEPYVLISGIPGGGPMGEVCRENDIPIISTQYRLSFLERKTTCYYFRRITRRVMRFYDYIKIFLYLKKNGYSFDVIHSNSSVFDVGYYLSRWMDIPHVWHIREFAEAHYDLYFVSSEMRRNIQYKNSYMVGISEAIIGLIKDRCGENLYKVYDGIEICKPYRKSYLIDNITNICIVGVCHKNKNQLDVIKACNSLLDMGISDFMLHIIGGCDGEYRDEIFEYIKLNPQIESHICFYGHRDDVNSLLRNMDIGIMASSLEALGRVTVEYMSNYMAVLGSNSGGTAEILPKELLFELHDIEDLALKLRQLIGNAEAISKIGNELRITSEEFEPMNSAVKIFAIYDKCLCKNE